jgi:hypothetical protein
MYGDGSWHLGYWHEGMKHGKGTFCERDGRKEEGNWEDGVMVHRI